MGFGNPAVYVMLTFPPPTRPSSIIVHAGSRVSGRGSGLRRGIADGTHNMVCVVVEFSLAVETVAAQCRLAAACSSLVVLVLAAVCSQIYHSAACLYLGCTQNYSSSQFSLNMIWLCSSYLYLYCWMDAKIRAREQNAMQETGKMLSGCSPRPSCRRAWYGRGCFFPLLWWSRGYHLRDSGKGGLWNVASPPKPKDCY